MRFLADMPISRSTTEHLQSKGHDAVHLLDLGLERAKDKEIAKLAVTEKRILLTMDLDFASIVAVSKSALPSVIIFRLRDNRPITINNLLDKNLSKIAPELEKGAIAIFEESRVRLRELSL
jgi:predicted nuclease of predicted toxin-antitoxin system